MRQSCANLTWCVLSKRHRGRIHNVQFHLYRGPKRQNQTLCVYGDTYVAGEPLRKSHGDHPAWRTNTQACGSSQESVGCILPCGRVTGQQSGAPLGAPQRARCAVVPPCQASGDPVLIAGPQPVPPSTLQPRPAQSNAPSSPRIVPGLHA